MVTPFFILSSGRSGSTLLASMLNMHPNLYVPVELFGLYNALPQRIKHYGDLRRRFNLELLCHDLGYIGQLKELGVELDPVALRDALEQGDLSYPAIVRGFYAALLNASGKRRIGDKTPNNSPFTREILSIFPDARIIHLIRDGRDCALSSIRSRRGLNQRNALELGTLWARNNRHIARTSRDHDYLRVHYEALIQNPDRELERICEFLGEQYSAELLEFADGEFARLNAQTLAHHGNLESAVISDNLNKWRDGMGATQLCIYESVAGPALCEFGYELSQRGPSRGWRLNKCGQWLATRFREAGRWTRDARTRVWANMSVRAKRAFRVHRLGEIPGRLLPSR